MPRWLDEAILSSLKFCEGKSMTRTNLSDVTSYRESMLLINKMLTKVEERVLI